MRYDSIMFGKVDGEPIARDGAFGGSCLGFVCHNLPPAAAGGGFPSVTCLRETGENKERGVPGGEVLRSRAGDGMSTFRC